MIGGERLGFKDWFNNFVKGDDGYLYMRDAIVAPDKQFTVAYKMLAISAAKNLISNALTNCEFQTFKKGEILRANTYYLFNVQPNKNQCASEFKREIIGKLIEQNECLVVMYQDELFIADSFTKGNQVINENYYKDVTVKEITFSQSFRESEVLYFKLHDTDISKIIDNVYSDYAKLIKSAKDYYKLKNNKRYELDNSSLRGQDTETQKKVDDLITKQMSGFLDPDTTTAVFSTQKGIKLEDVSDKSTGGASNSNTTKDIRDLINDVIDQVAMAFHIPRGLLKGDLSDLEKQMDSFIALCIKPIAKIIQDEINRKYYGKEEFLSRTYLKVDTSRIKEVDISNLATALDKLFAIGGITINNILEILGREPIKDPIGDQRFVTKNYQSVEALKGGETLEETS